MALLLYDFEGNELGFTDKIISSYRDALWNDVGTSEFHLEKDDAFVTLITENKYLFLEDENNFQDIIVGYELKDDFTVYCRSLSWLLTKMIVPPITFSGTVSDCVERLSSVSMGCDISLGNLPSISDNYSLQKDDVTLFSDTLKACLDTSHSGHSVRFSHSDNHFYLDILTGNDLDFYISQNDCTLHSLTLDGDILDVSNSFCFKQRMKYMGQWNPSLNDPQIYDGSASNYATYYTVNTDSAFTRFGTVWRDGDYLYCNTDDGKIQKSSSTPEAFYVYVPDSSVDDKYKWYHISRKENINDASNALSEYSQNKDFSAVSRNLSFLKDYKLGDFIKLQYTLNNKTVSVLCQFTSVVINRDNLDNTENPTLKEVK